MATLQAPKPRKQRAAQRQEQDDESRPIQPHGQQQQSPSELELLMMEPFSYDDVLTTTTSTLTRSQVQSLNSVKQVCLVALDSLLRQIVRGCNKAERRHSESSFQDLTQRTLLHSIDEQTQRLAGVRGPLRRRDSSPALATISQVQEMLTYSPVVGNDTMDHDLACAVAALLEHVYRLLEDVQSPTKEDAAAPMMERVHGDDLFAHLQGVLQQQVTHMTGTTDLWDELRQLIRTVGTLIGQRAANASAAVAQQGMDDATVEENKELGENDPLPAYDDIMDRPVGEKSESDEKANEKDEKDEKDEKSEKATDRPPSYRARTPERTQKDLDLLVSSIDRLSDLMPRLNNQRVDLSDRQADALAAATMGRTIDRLSRGRLDDQRASATDALVKYNHLPSLMAQLQRSASRTLDNQRASFDPKFQRQMNAAALSRLVAKNDRGRMANQEWSSPEQQMIDDMLTMSDLLCKSMNRPRFNSQRYHPSPLKEKEVFLSHILHKLDRMEARRMQNQDAEWREKPNDGDDELNRLFDHIVKSKSLMDNQRASFSNAPSSSSS